LKVIDMWEEAREWIENSPEDSSIYIGCDSQVNREKKLARYSVVVVVHKSSRNGARVFHHEEVLPDYGNLKVRLLNEVGYSTKVAEELIDSIGDRHMEIHIDINTNPKHKSHIALSEAMGWIKGLGYEVKAKPDSWAAHSVGDHYVRKSFH
jgi:predicted RNase H-related nuclease YkuK (DUF458 family)